MSCASCGSTDFRASDEADRVSATDSGGCPKCGSKEVQRADLLKRRVNSTVLMLEWLGGWVLAGLWMAGAKERVRCRQCDAIFERSTRFSTTARILFAIVLALV